MPRKKQVSFESGFVKINMQEMIGAETLPARYLSVTARGGVILDIVCVSL